MARKMKDSGIEWIGEIPEEWETGKVKKYYNIQIGFTPDTKNELLYDDTNGYDWVNISDMIDGQTIINTKKKISQYYIEICKPKIIPKGSLMYSFKLSVGQTAYAGKNIYSNEAIASFLPSETVNLFFLRYSSIFIILNAQTNIYNAKILNQDLIKNAYVIFPTLDEQQRIADFLDQKCAQIDEILQKTRDTIAEYKKLKQSIITQAVTKGVCGERPMKDSGIEWIGEIPEEWEIRKLFHICSIITDYVASGSFASLAENVNYLDEADYAMLVRTIDISDKGQNRKPVYVDKYAYDFLHNSNLFGGELLFPNIGASVGDIYIVPKLYKKMTLAPNAIMVKTSIVDKYIYYYFQSKSGRLSLIDIAQSTAQPKFNKTDFRQLKVPVPLVDEQQEIAQYLDEKCSEIDTLIEKKEQLVNELESYKKSLIYEYVTGKKEVL